MAEEIKGKFSKSFLSIQLQLKTLLEEAGGEDLLELLDTLSNLSKSEQKAIIRSLNESVKHFQSSEKRFITDGDLALKEFEESLYQGLLSDIEEEMNSKGRAQLSLVENGGTTPMDPIINLEEERKRRR